MNNFITIKFGEKEYVVKKSMRALLLFEELTGKPMSKIDDSLNNTITLFYCILKVANKDFNCSFDEFVDLIDDNIDSINVFTEYLQSEAKKNVLKQRERKKK